MAYSIFRLTFRCRRRGTLSKPHQHPVQVGSSHAANHDSTASFEELDTHQVPTESQPGIEVPKQKCDQACQTTAHDSGGNSFSMFICLAQGGDVCTQVDHTPVCDAVVQCTPAAVRTVSRHSGPDKRTSFFSGYESVKDCSVAMRDLCGVTLEVFALLLSLLPAASERSCDVPVCDRLVMFLMKLKLGITYSSLAILFSVSRKTVSRHFHGTLRTLSTATEKWIFRPPTNVLIATMPDCFKVHYPGCTMIIDCTEVATEKPPTVPQQRVLYSNYKGGYTVKFLVGIAPCGQVCFKSKAYGGRCSDAYVTVDSGFLDLVQPGDVIMSDKGFPGIKAGLEGAQAVLVMPPFLKGQDQFTETEVRDTYDIAQVRIHVERVIQRIKTYHILNTRVSIELIAEMSDVFHLCCILANLQPPIINEEESVDPSS
ncbi:uncharacterized protein LOC144137580 [Haemaphysalis longicornis]